MNTTHIDEPELVVIRHGQSTANASSIWQGQLEFPLSELGRRQATEAGLALHGEEISGVYSSPLSRAFETARIVARWADYKGEAVPVADLMERHGGVLQGHTWAEQEARDPGLIEKFMSVPEEERWSIVGAETDEEILARFEKALRWILVRHAPGDRIILVSHGGVMRAYLRDKFGPEVFPGAERAPNASITRLRNPTGPQPRLLELASTKHLTSTQ